MVIMPLQKIRWSTFCRKHHLIITLTWLDWNLTLWHVNDRSSPSGIIRKFLSKSSFVLPNIIIVFSSVSCLLEALASDKELTRPEEDSDSLLIKEKIHIKFTCHKSHLDGICAGSKYHDLKFKIPWFKTEGPFKLWNSKNKTKFQTGKYQLSWKQLF